MKLIVIFSLLLVGLMGQQKMSHETELWQKVFIYQSHQKFHPDFWVDDMDGFLMNKAHKACLDIMEIVENKPIEKTKLEASTYQLESTIKTIQNGPHIFPLKREEPSKYKINYFSTSF